jgi:hypothetical protein
VLPERSPAWRKNLAVSIANVIANIIHRYVAIAPLVAHEGHIIMPEVSHL